MDFENGSGLPKSGQYYLLQNYLQEKLIMKVPEIEWTIPLKGWVL